MFLVSLLLVDGEPHPRQLECSTGLRSVGCCLLNFTMLSFSLIAKNRNPAAPVHSQISKRGRRELVQRGCDLQLWSKRRSLTLGEVTWVLGGPWAKQWACGGEGEHCSCSGSPQGSHFPYFVKKTLALISIAECCWHFCWVEKSNKTKNNKKDKFFSVGCSFESLS